MSAHNEAPRGNLGHAKSDGVRRIHQDSERGNQYPILNLEISFRDPKHIRIRSMADDGRVVDSLGCNDIAEAVVWVGATVRCAETMYARPIRKELRLG